MFPTRLCGFGRHRFACLSELLAGGGWRLDGHNKTCLPALFVCCLTLAVFSSVAIAQEQPISLGLSSRLDIWTYPDFVDS